MNGTGKKRSGSWMKITLTLAGIYNLLWGGFVVLFPRALFELAGLAHPLYPEIAQCVGMIVGVYGVGYLIAARDPVRHWPIVFVGLLGKVLGPVGFVMAATRGDLPWIVGVAILTNDIIWWIPFAALLVATWLSVTEGDSQRDETTREASAWEIDLFYDGDCPLCKREVALLRRLDRKRKISFTDIADPEFCPLDDETDMSSLMAEIHGRLPDGTWLRGVEVFRRLYSAVGLGWIVTISRLPVISHILDLGYHLFARNRLRLTGRCSDACEISKSPPTSDDR